LIFIRLTTNDRAISHGSVGEQELGPYLTPSFPCAKFESVLDLENAMTSHAHVAS
jgi:hypothetical protein